MKKIIFLLALAFLFFISPLRAQEATPSSQSTSSAQKIREAVQEKIKAYSTGRPAGFVGTLKDLADLTLTIETKNGLKQASTSSETTILRLSKGSKKTIEFADLTLKEAVIALGYKLENNVLDAKRVIVTTEITPLPEREIIIGNITEKQKNLLTLKTVKNEIKKMKIDTKTVLTMKNDGQIEEIESEDLGLDNRLIAICKPAAKPDEPLTVLRLHLLRQ